MAYLRTTDETYLTAYNVGLVTVVLVGAILRLYRLGEEALWIDEGFTLFDATTRPLLDVVFLPTIKLHMPVYYLVVRFWTALFGASEVSLRFPSAVFGIATIPVTIYVATRLFDRRVGLVAGVLLALSPFHLFFSQEARMYSLATLLTVGSYYFLMRAAETDGRREWAWYSITTAVLALSHSAAMLVILAQNIFVFGVALFHRRQRLRVSLQRWVPIQAAIGLVVSPWALMFLETLMQRSASGTTPGMGVPAITDILYTPVVFLTGGLNGVVTLVVGLGLLALTGVTVTLGLARLGVMERPSNGWLPSFEWAVGRDHGTLLVGTWLVVPTLGPIVMSYLGLPMFNYRYMLVAVPAFFIVISLGVRNLQYRHVGYAMAGAMLVAMMASVPVYYDDIQKQQWDNVGAYVEANAETGDLVIVVQGGNTKGGTVTAFQYYFDREDVTVETAPLRADSDRISRMTAGTDGVWLVLTSGSSETFRKFTDTLDASHRRVEGHRYPSDNTWHIELYHYERPA